VISGFLRVVNEIFAFLKYYAVYNCSYLGDPGVDWRVIFRWIFRKSGGGEWTGSSWLMIGTGGGHV
jgi:hypothetical protein